jgi:transposase
MAYDEKFRRRVIEYKDAGHTFKEVYEAFGADAGRYYSWKKLFTETGSLKSRLPSERNRKINKEELRRLVDEHPGWYLREFAKKLNVCFQAVHQMFKKLGITSKKTFTYSGKSEEKREEYLGRLAGIPEENRVYVSD